MASPAKPHERGDAPQEWPRGAPTTLRFSRRAGEAWHDAEYASAIERPQSRRYGSAPLALAMYVIAFAGVYGLLN